MSKPNEQDRQRAIDALTRQNPRFKLYWDQGDRSREPDVNFWANEFATLRDEIAEKVKRLQRRSLGTCNSDLVEIDDVLAILVKE